jgi:hypothetical protein
VLCLEWTAGRPQICRIARCSEHKIAGAERVRSEQQVLAVGATHDSHELFDLPTLISLAACIYGVFDTMTDMIPKDFLFNPSQGGTDGGDLRHDVDTVSIVLDHAGEAPDLPLDPVEALRA